jgi:hypothetical protein
MGIFNVAYYIKSCPCGETKAFYFDQENMVYTGDATAIGIDNRVMQIAQDKQSVDGEGAKIESYIIPLWCNSAIKAKDLNDFTARSLKRTLRNGENYKKQWDSKIDKKRTGINFGRLLYIIGKKFMQLEINKLNKKYPKENEEWYTNLSDRITEMSKMINLYYRNELSLKDCYSLIYTIVQWKPESMNDLYMIEDGRELAKALNSLYDLWKEENPIEDEKEVKNEI